MYKCEKCGAPTRPNADGDIRYVPPPMPPKSNASLRAALLKFVDHFGPLEDNHMLHEDARKCFRLARTALGPEDHDAAIKRSLNQ